jgi:hypothetical protein
MVFLEHHPNQLRPPAGMLRAHGRCFNNQSRHGGRRLWSATGIVGGHIAIVVTEPLGQVTDRPPRQSQVRCDCRGGVSLFETTLNHLTNRN